MMFINIQYNEDKYNKWKINVRQQPKLSWAKTLVNVSSGLHIMYLFQISILLFTVFSLRCKTHKNFPVTFYPSRPKVISGEGEMISLIPHNAYST